MNPVCSAYTHAAGYGFLYQITGDKKFAEFGKQCMLKMIDEENSGIGIVCMGFGTVDPYGWVLFYRVSPGYDLCYDGWDKATREYIAKTSFSRWTAGVTPFA